MKKPILYAIIVIVALAIGGGSFYGGTVYAKSHATRGFTAGNFAGRTGAGGTAGARTGAGFTGGQIIAKDDSSITVKAADGSSKIIFYSGSTQISKFDQGTSSDLSIGQNVSVMSSTNSDGSLTAQSIQLRPAMPTTPAAN